MKILMILHNESIMFDKKYEIDKKQYFFDQNKSNEISPLVLSGQKFRLFFFMKSSVFIGLRR